MNTDPMTTLCPQCQGTGRVRFDWLGDPMLEHPRIIKIGTYYCGGCGEQLPSAPSSPHSCRKLMDSTGVPRG